MGRIPNTTLIPLAASLLVFAGCVHPGKSGVKSEKPPAAPTTTAEKLSSVWPASMSMKDVTSMVVPTAKPPQAVQMACMWQNYISRLPDPTKNGTMMPGLVGKLFLLDDKYQNVVSNGKLTVDLYDESGGKTGDAAKLIERWEFDKETVKKLATSDELFSRCYAVFLPWPGYKPEINQVRLMVKYEPAEGHALYAPAESLSLDANGGQRDWTSNTSNSPLPPVAPGTLFGNPRGGAQAPANLGTLSTHGAIVAPGSIGGAK